MADEDKPRVTIKRPDSVRDRTNTLSINAETAHRIVARYLRDEGKMQPGAANELATKVIVGIRTSMPAPTRPGLRNYRLIPDMLHYEERMKLSATLKRMGVEASADEIWRTIYEMGEPAPDDITA
jgi:hypothetical protein